VAFLPVKLVEENPGGLSSYEVEERNPRERRPVAFLPMKWVKETPVAFLPMKTVEENPGKEVAFLPMKWKKETPSGFSSYENCGRKSRKREGWRKLGIRVQIPAGAY